MPTAALTAQLLQIQEGLRGPDPRLTRYAAHGIGRGPSQVFSQHGEAHHRGISRRIGVTRALRGGRVGTASRNQHRLPAQQDGGAWVDSQEVIGGLRTTFAREIDRAGCQVRALVTARTSSRFASVAGGRT